MWDPATYLAFDDHRSRPFYDLLGRVRAEAPREIADLGCGPGNLTAELARRWPSARVYGIDSSAEMVAAAGERGVRAEQVDVAEWSPGPETDVVFCSATLQWVPGHLDLLTRWVRALPAGAWLAVQVPGNFGSPSHRTIRGLASESPWREELGQAVLQRDAPVAEPVEYADLLAGLGCAVDVWETTYVQRLTGADPVLEWVTGTALRPVRAALSDERWERFRAELAPRLREAYPPSADSSTWFPFRRIFVVAQCVPGADTAGATAASAPG